MSTKSSSILGITKAAFKDFGEDECAVRAAALAYYTVFALPPLLVLLIMIAGMVWDPQDVQRALESGFASMLGDSGAKQVHEMIVRADQPGSGGVIRTIASIAGLLFGATGAFMQLQGALNRAWEVKPDPEQGGVMRFITKRLLSLGMVLGVGFLLAVSLALTSAVSALGGMIGGGLSEPLLHVMNFVLSFIVLTLLFGAMFKILPDAEMAWRDVWVGAVVTGLLFVLGKFAIGMYLGRSSPGDAFGAAGALAVVLVWAYYAGMIMLFGAEFTQKWATERGSGIRPEKGAVRVIETQTIERPGDAPATGTKGDQAAAKDQDAGAGGPLPPPRGEGGLGKALLGLPIFFFLARNRRRP